MTMPYGAPPQGAPPQAPPTGQPPAGAPQAPQGPTAVDPNMRIRQGDPNFPVELHGRTVGEAMRYYGIMRQDFINRNKPDGSQPPLAGQPPVGAPPASAPPAARAPFAAPPAAQPPAGAPPGYVPVTDVQSMVDAAVSRALQPHNRVSAQQVYQQVARQFQDWGHWDGQIQEALAGASPEELLNPEVWKSAYYFVKGRGLTHPAPPPQNGQPPAAAASQPPFQQDWQPPAYNGPQRDARGAIVTPPPQPPSGERAYFSEAPTAPGGPGAGYVGEDPQDAFWAAKFNIPVEEYRQWKNGRVPAPPAPPQAPAGQPPQGGFRGY